MHNTEVDMDGKWARSAAQSDRKAERKSGLTGLSGWRDQLVWGIIIIVVGLAILAQRMDVAEIGELWTWWPLLFVVVGIIKMVPPTTPSLIVDGCYYIAFAALFYIVSWGLWGLNYFNFWPLLLIVWGAGLVLRSIVNHYFDQKEHHDVS